MPSANPFTPPVLFDEVLGDAEEQRLALVIRFGQATLAGRDEARLLQQVVGDVTTTGPHHEVAIESVATGGEHALQAVSPDVRRLGRFLGVGQLGYRREAQGFHVTTSFRLGLRAFTWIIPETPPTPRAETDSYIMAWTRGQEPHLQADRTARNPYSYRNHSTPVGQTLPTEFGIMAVMQDPTPLKKCPRCGYSLTGLPDAHQCPECAFGYDKRSVVIVQSETLAWVGLFMAGYLILTDLVLLSRYSLWIVLWIVMFAQSVRTIYYGKRSKALISPEGIALLSDRGELTHQFQWGEVERVEYNRLGGGAKLIGASGRTVYAISYEFLGSKGKSREFIATANHMRAIYQANASSA